MTGSRHPDGPHLEATSVLHVAGELDLATAPGLRRRLQRAGAATTGDVVVDLSGVTFMDCSGLAPLLEARARLGDRLWLSEPAWQVTWLLGATELKDAFALVGAADLQSGGEIALDRGAVAGSELVGPG